MEEINNIIWSPRSKANIKEIHEYISEYSRKKADSFLNDVIHSVEDLMAFPKIYRHYLSKTIIFELGNYSFTFWHIL